VSYSRTKPADATETPSVISVTGTHTLAPRGPTMSPQPATLNVGSCADATVPDRPTRSAAATHPAIARRLQAHERFIRLLRVLLPLPARLDTKSRPSRATSMTPYSVHPGSGGRQTSVTLSLSRLGRVGESAITRSLVFPGLIRRPPLRTLSGTSMLQRAPHPTLSSGGTARAVAALRVRTSRSGAGGNGGSHVAGSVESFTHSATPKLQDRLQGSPSRSQSGSPSRHSTFLFATIVGRPATASPT